MARTRTIDSVGPPRRVGWVTVRRRLAWAGLLGLLMAASGCHLYGWGYNSTGQVGDGSYTPRQTPVAVARNPGWVAVDNAEYHTCAIDVARQLFCWGLNARGALGTGSMDSSAVPVQVGTATDWTAVSAGGTTTSDGFTCGIRTGVLFCWGDNSLGRLGLGDQGWATPRTSPAQVGTKTDWISVSAGLHGQVCGIRAPGSLWCWGGGTGMPTRVGMASDWTAARVGDHRCGIRAGGSLWCWGDNWGGEIGIHPDVARSVAQPTRVASHLTWSSVSPGVSHTCGIAANTVYCWGNNSGGELGRGFVTTVPYPGGGPAPLPVPEPVAAPAGDWTAIAAAEARTCALRRDGSLHCWGVDPFSFE